MKKIVFISRDGEGGGFICTKKHIYDFLQEGKIVCLYSSDDPKISHENFQFYKINKLGSTFITKEFYFFFYSIFIYFNIRSQYNIFIFPSRHGVFSFCKKRKIITIFHSLHLGAAKGHLKGCCFFPYLHRKTFFIHFLSVFLHCFYCIFDIFNLATSHEIYFVNPRNIVWYSKIFFWKKNHVYHHKNIISYFSPKYHNKIQKGSARLLFVGRLEPLKGIDILCELINRSYSDLEKVIGQFELTIVGKGILESQLRRYDFINLVGHVPHEKMSPYYQNSDLFIFPSLYENSPLVVYEALAFGCPVLAAPVGYLPYENLDIHLSEITDMIPNIKKLLKNGSYD